MAERTGYGVYDVTIEADWTRTETDKDDFKRYSVSVGRFLFNTIGATVEEVTGEFQPTDAEREYAADEFRLYGYDPLATTFGTWGGTLRVSKPVYARNAKLAVLEVKEQLEAVFAATEDTPYETSDTEGRDVLHQFCPPWCRGPEVTFL